MTSWEAHRPIRGDMPRWGCNARARPGETTHEYTRDRVRSRRVACVKRRPTERQPIGVKRRSVAESPDFRRGGRGEHSSFVCPIARSPGGR